jgi:hypothetical protein
VISEMTSAKMRRMMEGVVTEGTGKEAAVERLQRGGKTGTAQKIDLSTHTYSKTKCGELRGIRAGEQPGDHGGGGDRFAVGRRAPWSAGQRPGLSRTGARGARIPGSAARPLRRIVEQAGASGLGVEAIGDGLARDQAPAPGTMVPLGTEVVVRLSR